MSERPSKYRAGARSFHCDQCAAVLYWCSGNSIVSDPETGETRPPPIVLTVRSYVRVLFCSRSCAARWLLAQPDTELRPGYPLDWR